MTDETPNLDRFIAAKTDDERMALGIDVLRNALSEATSSHLLGWEEAVSEFVNAWPDGPNRPL